MFRGLVKQHIDSFNYLINEDMRNIILAKNNNLVLSDYDPSFYLKYKDIRVGKPSLEEMQGITKLTPHECFHTEMMRFLKSLFRSYQGSHLFCSHTVNKSIEMSE